MFSALQQRGQMTLEAQAMLNELHRREVMIWPLQPISNGRTLENVNTRPHGSLGNNSHRFASLHCEQAPMNTYNSLPAEHSLTLKCWPWAGDADYRAPSSHINFQPWPMNVSLTGPPCEPSSPCKPQAQDVTAAECEPPPPPPPQQIEKVRQHCRGKKL